MMYDIRAEGRKWNISFYDYSSNLGGAELGTDYSENQGCQIFWSKHTKTGKICQVTTNYANGHK
jgi:hypothetical protein